MTVKYEVAGEKIGVVEQWVLAFLDQSDGYESVQTVTSEFKSYDSVSIHKVRRALRTLESAGLADSEKEETRGAINDRKMYRISQDGADHVDDRDISVPVHLRDNSTSSKVEELEEKIQKRDQRIDDLENRYDTLEASFNAQQETIADLQEQIRYFRAEQMHYIPELVSEVEDLGGDVERWDEDY